MTPTTFRHLREHLGLSVAYAADNLGVNRRQVSRWESGENRLPDRATDWLQGWVQVTEAQIQWATQVANQVGALCLHGSNLQYRAAHRSGFLDHQWWNTCMTRVAASTGAELEYELCQKQATKPPRVLAPACESGVE